MITKLIINDKFHNSCWLPFSSWGEGRRKISSDTWFIQFAVSCCMEVEMKHKPGGILRPCSQGYNIVRFHLGQFQTEVERPQGHLNVTWQGGAHFFMNFHNPFRKKFAFWYPVSEFLDYKRIKNNMESNRLLFLKTIAYCFEQIVISISQFLINFHTRFRNICWKIMPWKTAHPIYVYMEVPPRVRRGGSVRRGTKKSSNQLQNRYEKASELRNCRTTRYGTVPFSCEQKPNDTEPFYFVWTDKLEQKSRSTFLSCFV